MTASLKAIKSDMNNNRQQKRAFHIIRLLSGTLADAIQTPSFWTHAQTSTYSKHCDKCYNFASKFIYVNYAFSILTNGNF